MVRVAIAEDDENYIQELRKMLTRYGEEHKVSFHVDCFHDGDQIVERFPADCDILFLDILLPLLDGMSAAEEIRRIDGDVAIVFVTVSPQYAIQGYKVGATDYLLKPVNYAAFSRTLTRILEQRNRKKPRTLLISIKGGQQKLDISRILYIEVQNHELIFHTRDGELRGKGSLRRLLTELEAEDFFRCNKEYLVNLACVDGIYGQEIQVGNQRLAVSRTRKKAFLDAYNVYMS